MAIGRSQPRGAATRADIVHVARRLISEHGYHSTGIADIQTATGLTKGAFYHHFRTKEELALAVLEAAQEDYANHLLEPVMMGPSPGRRFAAMLEGVLALNARPEWRNCQMIATLCAELTIDEPRLRKAVCDLQQGMFRLWRELIAKAQESGEADPALDPDLWSQWIVNTWTGALLTRKVGSDQVPAARIIEQIRRIVLKPS